MIFIQIFDVDGFSKHICSVCIKKLEAAYVFRQQCWNSNNLLKKQLHEKWNNKTNSVFIKCERLLEKSDEIVKTENVCNDINDQQNTLPILKSDVVAAVAIDSLASNNLLNQTKKPKRKRKKPTKKQIRKPYVPDPRVCEICGQVYSSPRVLQFHKKCCHENRRPFPCQLCDYRGHSKRSLRVNIILKLIQLHIIHIK